MTDTALQSLLGKLTDALGGRAALEGAAVERTIATGWRRHPGWGTDPAKPELVAEFSATLDLDVVGPRYRWAHRAKTYLVPTDLDYVEVGAGGRGHVSGVDFMFDPRPVDLDIPSWRVAARLRHFDLTSPLRLVRRMLAPGADVTAGPGDVLTLREFGRPPVRVTLDAATGLPRHADLTEEHSPLGDAAVRITFDDFHDVSGVRVPFQVDITVDGQHVHSETRTEASISASASEELFAVSGEIVEPTLEQAAYALNSTEWVMNYVYSGVRFYFDLQTAPVTPEPVDLAPGVKLVIGPSHNTMVVELPDRLLAVESPLYDDYSRAALAQVKRAFPGKPLRELVCTHFHYDHVGGVREFAADGDLTVHVGTPAVEFFERALSAPHHVDPDRLASGPVRTSVRGVAESLSFETAGGGTVTAYRIVSDHADDMMIVHVSSGGLVFNSDLWNPTPGLPESGDQRGRLATQLYDAIQALGLDVTTVVGGHRGSDGKTSAHAAPIEYLKRAAGY
ncbi:MBL fold metallo-hydrolase [Amycolatopsis rhabdoformis]|uniref:MBL fold metallo-hydrolase n=1 Tax=Amycolatopsis rhabdoformis TaxID=1448059 RepID=A0ABZ1IIU2_9PSEU|nr:MBL fold metallo-hydrolase [Amycolatopsis rhabdoformis]WSE33325.1 MBL fold metallo-hydrolase [Amycolatopsis rhabdoformis]